MLGFDIQNATQVSQNEILGDKRVSFQEKYIKCKPVTPNSPRFFVGYFPALFRSYGLI
jgi:hypothetical protein